jgi:hypothetical protein
LNLPQNPFTLTVRGENVVDAFLSSLFGPVASAYFVGVVVNLGVAYASGNWRLRMVGWLFLTVWLLTNIAPYTEIIVGPASFVVLSLLQIRRRGEKELSWWMVPLIAAEAAMFCSHVLYNADTYFLHYALVQLLFAAQLSVTITTGAKLALRRHSITASKKNDEHRRDGFDHSAKQLG